MTDEIANLETARLEKDVPRVFQDFAEAVMGCYDIARAIHRYEEGIKTDDNPADGRIVKTPEMALALLFEAEETLQNTFYAATNYCRLNERGDHLLALCKQYTEGQELLEPLFDKYIPD